MKKPIKALACGLALCMALSSPVSALAGSITDIFTQSGDSQDGGALDTDTSTGTHTRTNSTPIDIDEEIEYDVVGVAFDKEAVTAIIDDVPENPILTAMILINADDSQKGTESIRVQELMAYDDLMLTFGDEKITAPELYKNLVFYEDKEVSEANGIINEDEDGNFKPLVTLEVLDREWDKDKKEWKTGADSDKVKIEGKKGGKTYVSVKLGETYKASALVTVKDYSQEINFKKDTYNAYQNWTVDMMKELEDTYGMDITFRAYTVNSKNQKQTTYKTMKSDGKLTLKKVANKVYVTAVAENGKMDTAEITVTAGDPVKSLSKKPKTTIKMDSTKKELEELSVEAKAKDSNKTITDEITWTSSNKHVVEVVEEEISPQEKGSGEGENNFIFGYKFDTSLKSTAKIKALNPGTAKITALTSTGKKTTFTVKVTAPVKEINGIDGREPLYSGQSEVLTADTDPKNTDSKITWKVYILKDAKDEDYDNPQTFEPTDDNKKKFKSGSSYATIKVIKTGLSTTKATLTAKAKNEKKLVYVQATAKKADGTPANSKYYPVKLVRTLVSGNSKAIIFKTDEKTKKDIISASTSKKQIELYKGKAIDLDAFLHEYVNDTNNNNETVDVEYNKAQNMVTWKTNKPKIATVDPRTGRIEAIGNGTAKITVSVVGVKSAAKKTVAKTFTDTITVKVIAPATGIKLNRTETSVDPLKNSTVSLSIKQYLPKGCVKESATWDYTYYKNDKAESQKPSGITFTPAKNGKSVKIKIEKGKLSAGDEIVVTAKAKSGATAKATIYIRDASKVKPVDATKIELTVADENVKALKGSLPKGELDGRSLDLSKFFIVVSSAKAGKEPTDPVYEDRLTYTANKKGIVNIVGTKLYPVKAGTVTITAKTPSGKSAKITVVVKDAPTPTAK